HEFLFAQLTGHRAEDTRAAGIVFLVNDDHGIAVKTQIGTIVPRNRLPGANHDGVADFALLHRAIRRGFLDVNLDDVTDAGIHLVASEDTDRGGALGARVIGNI